MGINDVSRVVQKIGSTLGSGTTSKVLQYIFMGIFFIWVFFKFAGLFGGIAERKRKEKFKRLKEKEKKHGKY